jgi:endo-alpha-1,4-polygalactosaminidase (GH114 family)
VNWIVMAAIAAAAVAPPPVDEQFDYQIGGDYSPAAGVTVVSRDWFNGTPLGADDTYSICYVNAFQTQDDEDSADRPDERSNWPPELVLFELGDDPNWGGEYLVDISTAKNRQAAQNHVQRVIDACADKGFAAVEFDNLDSWTRFDDTELEGQVPFGQDEAVAYAELLTDYAHDLGLAVGQKNTPQLGAETSLDVIGFDFAIAEECGFYNECSVYTDVFGANVIVIEYTEDGFNAACDVVGDEVSVVLRDIDVTTPESETYVYDSC